MAHRLTPGEKQARQDALPLFLRAWWDRYHEERVYIRVLAVRADEWQLAVPLVIRRDISEDLTSLSLRLSRLLRSLSVRRSRIGPIRILDGEEPGTYWLVWPGGPKPPPPPPEPPDGRTVFFRAWWRTYGEALVTAQQLFDLAVSLELLESLEDPQKLWGRFNRYFIRQITDSICDKLQARYSHTRGGRKYFYIRPITQQRREQP